MRYRAADIARIFAEIAPPSSGLPGDELRLDTVRFLLVAPGMEIGASTRPTVQLAQPSQGKSKAGLWIGIAVAVAAAAGAAWYFLA